MGDAAEFNFKPIIETLRDFIASAPVDAPFNICVSGNWGTGKTTVLSNLEAALEPNEDEDDAAGATKYVTIWFDPWKLDSEEEVRNALARAILSAIEDDSSFVAQAEMSVERRNVIRMLSERLFRVDPDEVSSFYRAETKTRDTFIEIEEIFQQVAAVYLNDPDQPRRLVIFVDDLDRCRPARITRVLESVKLFFDLPGLIFVFALDSRQLERAVANDYEMAEAEAQEYIEKIFQLTIRLPRKGGADLRGFLAANLKKIGVELDNDELYSAIVERYGRNLRNLKLFINWFSFQRQLIGEVSSIDEDALFRWLYLDSTMDRSMKAAISGGLGNLALALEFLAHGGFLHNEKLRSRYLSQLDAGKINYVALIAYSMIASLDDSDLPPTTILDHHQLALVEAMQADGELVPTLKVIREGNTLFIDNDVSRMIYLTRSGEDGDPARVSESSVHEPQKEERLAGGNPLSSQEWNQAGDRMLGRGRPIEAYLCHLVATLMDPGNAAYVCDVARAYRRVNRREATKELHQRAYELDPQSLYVIVEIAYFYDTTLIDEETGSLLYRMALEMGTKTATVPYYLAMNLHKEGRYDDAYLACLDATVRDHENEAKQERLARYAHDAGMTDRPPGRSPEELAAELSEAVSQGRYPLRLDDAERAVLQARLAEKPDPEAAEAELSRPPF